MRLKYLFNKSISTLNAFLTSDAKLLVILYELTNSLKVANVKLPSILPNVKVLCWFLQTNDNDILQR